MNIKKIRESKNQDRLVMLTSYDAITAAIVSQGGADIILVGDSLANTSLGMTSTLPLSLDSIIERCKAVCSHSGDALVVCDMPFLSYGISEEETIRNCGRVLKETGSHAVKMEGGEWLAPVIKKLVNIGVPVMGHVGLQPQHVNSYGGMFIQGRTEEEALSILKDSRELVEAGIFSLVAECIPEELGKQLTEETAVPVIGIGAGPHCDGQVQVISDLLGLTTGKLPKHAGQYASLAQTAQEAVARYSKDVRMGAFPGPDHCFPLSGINNHEAMHNGA